MSPLNIQVNQLGFSQGIPECALLHVKMTAADDISWTGQGSMHEHFATIQVKFVMPNVVVITAVAVGI